MRAKILLSTAFALAAFSGFAQKTSNKAFAITGDGNNDYLWMNIRQVDLGTGTVDKTIFEKNKTAFTITNVMNKSVVDQSASANGDIYNNDKYPTGTFVAAAAYDKRSGNLFFMPLRLGELRWVNVNGTEANKFYSLKTALVTPKADPRDEGGNITRMAIAANGKGYALSNDGNNLLEFTTSKTPSLISLGALIDADGNGAMSIHNKCSSWGGDMVADAFGKLWVVSANRQVFEVDVDTKIATYKGAITGLAATFTTNGAAVDDAGNLVVTSAVSFEGYYKVDINTLVATKIEGSDVKYNAADLAGSNLLLQKEKDASVKAGSGTLIGLDVAANTKVFPNPITGTAFRVQLDAATDGEVNVVISDLSGRPIQNFKTSVVKGQRLVSLNLAAKPAKGSYFIKVMNSKGETVLSDKILIM